MTAFAAVLQVTGFFARPALLIAALSLLPVKFGCCGAVLWLLTPWPGLAAALYLLHHNLPATCPTCGGRAFRMGSNQPPYRCADCGWAGG